MSGPPAPKGSTAPPPSSNQQITGDATALANQLSGEGVGPTTPSTQNYQALGLTASEASQTIQGGHSLLQDGQSGPMTLGDFMVAFAQLQASNPNLAANIQQDLSLGGFYSRSFTPIIGIIKPGDVTAMASAAKLSAKTGSDISQYLAQTSQYGQASGFGPAGLGSLTSSSNYYGEANITDPAQIQTVLTETFEKIIGRKPTQAQLAAFTDQFQGAEHSAAAQRFEFSTRAQRAFYKAYASQSTGTGANLNPDNTNSDFTQPATDLAATQTPGAQLELSRANIKDRSLNGAPSSPTLDASAPPTGQITTQYANRFAGQASQLFGLEVMATQQAKGGGTSADIGGPNGSAVQAMYNWALENSGPGKLFASAAMGPKGATGPTVHVVFNQQAGPDAQRAISALGEAATTSPENQQQQNQSFVQALKQAVNSGGYNWVQNPQTGGLGAYGFSYAAWQQGAGMVGLTQQQMANPTPQQQDSVAQALATSYYSKYHDWRAVAAAFFGGDGLASQYVQNPQSLQMASNGTTTAQSFTDQVLSHFQGPGGGSGNESNMSGDVTNVITPDLASDAVVAAQKSNPQAAVGMNFLTQSQNFSDLLKGPGYQSQPNAGA